MWWHTVDSEPSFPDVEESPPNPKTLPPAPEAGLARASFFFYCLSLRSEECRAESAGLREDLMSRMPLNLFTLHSRHWRDNRYVYPVISRRSKGLSIGVNLNPDKVCNFDCVYCCVDRTSMPGRVEVDLAVMRDELDHLLDLTANGEIWRDAPFDQAVAPLRRLNDVAFSGDGEPTSYVKFEEACRSAADALERRAMRDVKIVVITNATLFHQPRVQAALTFLDSCNSELWAKLDAGTPDYYKQVERTAVPFRQVLDNLLAAGRLRPIVIQSLFMNIEGRPPGDKEVDAYISRLHELTSSGCQIKLVQVYTIARSTAEAFVSPLSPGEVDAIAARVNSIGLASEAFYGPS